MSHVINKNLFLVKEHVGMFKAANNFDIHDPETGNIIMECREPSLGIFTKLLRFTDYKRMTPFDVQVTTPDGQLVFRIQRGISIFLSKVVVTDQNNKVLGGFQQKFFSIDKKLDVLDKIDQVVCQLQGKWTGWDFYFKNGEKEFAHVSPAWDGFGKGITFNSGEDYVLKIASDVPENHDVRKLILAAVMCIKVVLKE